MSGREVPHEREKPEQATGCGGGVGAGVGGGSEEPGAGDSACRGSGTDAAATVVRENKFLKQVYLLVEEG